MLSHDNKSGGKRRRESSSDHTIEPCPTKRHKADHRNSHLPRFWDTISVVRLTRGALRECGLRVDSTNQKIDVRKLRVCCSQRLLRSDYRHLREIAQGGGPNLTHLCGYAARHAVGQVMSQASSSSRKRSRGSSKAKTDTNLTTRTRTTTPYDMDFEQKLTDNGIFPKGYKTPGGIRLPKPNNVEELIEMLGQSRVSLSPSTFSGDGFEEFQDMNDQATSESITMSKIIPIIAGSNDKLYESSGEVPFYSLEKFDEDLSAPKPDIYYGTKPEDIEPRVRRDLAQYIVPSGRTTLPAVPNFFLKGKSTSGRPDVAQRQATYNGAVGARAMHKLQNYGNDTLVYDGNAYAIPVTYQPGTGTQQLYATHPRESTSGGTEYCITQLRAYAMTGNLDSFRAGATAYRNARDWAQQQRDRFIADANSIAQALSSKVASLNQYASFHGNSSNTAEICFSSETSTDELALDHDNSSKRRKPATLG